MKLYKEANPDLSRFRTGITHEEATVSDIRAAAKEMGYALVPVEPEFGVMVDTPFDRLFDRLDDFDVPVYGVEEAYKAMIKAAEDEQ